MKGLKIHIIVLACVVTLGAALIGQRFFYQARVADPLRAQIAEVSGVAGVTYQTSGGKRFVNLQLTDNADLRTVYTAADKLSRQSLGAAYGGILVQDNRNSTLTDSFYRMHFYVQQGIATGLFTDMAVGIDRIAEQEGLSSHKVFVDQDNVYVQLAQGGSHLYEVIARPQTVAQQQTAQQTRMVTGGTAA